MNRTSTRKLVICAIFAAICCVTTMVIAVPSFYTKGYINLGDVAVIITAYIVGGGYGAFAAGLGSALADASMSFYQYVPATFIIKSIMVLIGSFFFKSADKAGSKKRENTRIVVGVILTEVFMLIGYFVFELFLYKKGAFASILGSSIQGIVCAVISVMAVLILKENTFVKNIKKILKN